jgi:hypothetical protein
MAMYDGRQGGTGELTPCRRQVFAPTAAPMLRSNWTALPRRAVLAGREPKFYRQIFIIFMMKINFTHVLLSGMT